MQLPKLNIEPYLDMAWRRRWWIVVPVILCLLGGVFVAKTTPKVYRASTLILVQAQQIPPGIVRPMVSEDLTNRLYSIADQVLSRTNLERIITTYRLYHSREDRIQDFLSKLRQEIHRRRGTPEGEAAGEDKMKVDPLAMVDELRQKISIAPQGRGRTNGVRISFEWH
ncbi:MAG: Wzz/FepE/Etk N-terminal domain-containing protein, partial [Desulfosoma sp.]|uniref:Wzz/FepE/Etk N-terminal domain-containing protein n=1 Tax=Desulfosoma sp. TaxID=2603217 RepID=UPI00404A3D8C